MYCFLNVWISCIFVLSEKMKRENMKVTEQSKTMTKEWRKMFEYKPYKAEVAVL